MRTRQIATARAAWGFTLLFAAHVVDGDRRGAATVVAVLGARHLAQSAITLRRPSGVLAWWAWTADVAHGVSMLGLAALSRRWRAAALADAAIAASWAYLTRPTASPLADRRTYARHQKT